MNTLFLLITILFAVIAIAMILIILVQRPQGGGLAGAFGGAGGAGSDTVFGGRVGDALTWATVVAFVLYLGTAIALNKIESGITDPTAQAGDGAVRIQAPVIEPEAQPQQSDERPPMPQLQRIDPPPGFGGTPAEPE